MGEYEKGSQSLDSRAGGSTGKKHSGPWKGEDKTHTQVLGKTWLCFRSHACDKYSKEYSLHFLCLFYFGYNRLNLAAVGGCRYESVCQNS